MGLFIGLMIAYGLGENPWSVLKILVNGAFGSTHDLASTLFYTTPLIFTGLSVTIAFQCGLFNIGAEGQLLSGAFAATTVGILFANLGSPLAPFIAICASFIGGALWGFFAGYLKAKRGSHEVINTIMLNFIAVGITSWLTLYVFPNRGTQNPETQEIAAQFRVPSLFLTEHATVNFSFFLALLVAVLTWFFLWKTVLGYKLRATGQNITAARLSGISVNQMQILAMVLAGGVAGLVGVAEILGQAGKFRIGFSPEYGFMGIAVSLLGRNKPLGVVLSALLFGALHKGTMNLDLETENITRDLSLVFEALIILSVTAEGLWSYILERRK